MIKVTITYKGEVVTEETYENTDTEQLVIGSIDLPIPEDAANERRCLVVSNYSGESCEYWNIQVVWKDDYLVGNYEADQEVDVSSDGMPYAEFFTTTECKIRIEYIPEQ